MRSATSKSRSGRFAGAVLGISLAFGPRAARGQAYQVIHDFNGADASQPYAGLIRASDGNFYGTAPQGGAYNLGVTYRMDSSQNVQVMFSFPTNQFRYPASEMIESSGYLYGTAGASSGDQFVFRMDFLGNVTPLARVPCGPDSLFFDGLTEAFGSFYGVATGCGKGFLYRVDSSGTLTTLHSFSGRDGSTPQGDLILGTDGYLYGVTIFGGVYNGGTVFRADSQGNVTSIHSFDPCCGGPAYPRGRLLEASGELYGTTSGGASGRGTAYRMDFNGNVTVLHDFAGSPSDGDDPSFGLTQRTTGFYGTTGAGGDFGGGTVFQTDASGNTATIHSFGDIGDGATPMGELLNDSGALYGTTRAGGYGTIFMMTFKPKVIKLKKTAGPVFVPPGVPVQLKGVLFAVGGRAPFVTFGGLPATDVVVEDSETIDVLTPGRSLARNAPRRDGDRRRTGPPRRSSGRGSATFSTCLDRRSSTTTSSSGSFARRSMEGCGDGYFCQAGNARPRRLYGPCPQGEARSRVGPARLHGAVPRRSLPWPRGGLDRGGRQRGNCGGLRPESLLPEPETPPRDDARAGAQDPARRRLHASALHRDFPRRALRLEVRRRDRAALPGGRGRSLFDRSHPLLSQSRRRSRLHGALRGEGLPASVSPSSAVSVPAAWTDRRRLVFRLHPSESGPRDQSDHSPGLRPVPPIARVHLASAFGAGGVDDDRCARNPGGPELRGVDALQVQAEAAAAAGTDELPGELGGNLAADLVAAGADRGTDPRVQRRGRSAESCERANRLGRDVFRRAAPARVGGADGTSRREQNRYAVRGLDDDCRSRQRRRQRVAVADVRLAAGRRLADGRRVPTVNLMRPVDGRSVQTDGAREPRARATPSASPRPPERVRGRRRRRRARAARRRDEWL